MSEVWTAQNGQLVRRNRSTGSTLPTGPEYISYADLYQPGDTVTQALNRLTEPKIVTFPAGIYEFSDFAVPNTTGMRVPAICKGIIGSGTGTIDDEEGTIFRMVPNSSTKASQFPAQDNSTPGLMSYIYIGGSQDTLLLQNFRVQGTEQGHPYDALKIYNPLGKVTVQDLLITGWSGNNGAPPGETFGLSIYGAPDHLVERVEADGRRSSTGQAEGAVCFTAGNCNKGTWRDCWGHHQRANAWVGFQCFDVRTYNLRVGPVADRSRLVGNYMINHERTDGIVHTNTWWDGASPNYGTNITHSNDTYSRVYSGVTRSTVNGQCMVVNPIFTPIRADGYFYIESWSPYWNGDTMSSAPLVVQANGVTHIPYKWAHGGNGNPVIP